MCMLFKKPSNFIIPTALFDSLWECNPDGLSAYDLKTGKIFKSLCKNESKAFLDNSFYNDLIVHFRFATSGQSTLAQLHGFPIINGNFTLYHNGVLKTFNGNKTLSDTQQLAKFFSDKTLEFCINYLESKEQSSRFMLVNNATKQVIVPNCAKWAHDVFIDETLIKFSNTYAVCPSFLYDDMVFDTWQDSSLYSDYAEIDYLISVGDEKALRDLVITDPTLIVDYLMLKG